MEPYNPGAVKRKLHECLDTTIHRRAFVHSAVVCPSTLLRTNGSVVLCLPCGSTWLASEGRLFLFRLRCREDLADLKLGFGRSKADVFVDRIKLLLNQCLWYARRRVC